MLEAYELPASPNEAEQALADSLGQAGIRSIDETLVKATRAAWLKVARVVHDALRAGGFELDDAPFELHLRRVIALVEAGTLEAQGTLRRPRHSEVRLPTASRK